MAKSASVVAEDIRDIMNTNHKNVVTFQWDKMYEVADRMKWKASFQTQLTEELRKLSLLSAFGSAVVVIAKDYNFEPL
jgi:hypothetical protein